VSAVSSGTKPSGDVTLCRHAQVSSARHEIVE